MLHVFAGYTLAFWVNFKEPCDGETTYLSNGGQSLESHGVAMLYDKNNLQFKFRQKNGQVRKYAVLGGLRLWSSVGETLSDLRRRGLKCQICV